MSLAGMMATWLEAQVTSAIHFGGTWPSNVYLTAAKPQDPGNPFAGSWHIFSLEWEATEMRW